MQAEAAAPECFAAKRIEPEDFPSLPDQTGSVIADVCVSSLQFLIAIVAPGREQGAPGYNRRGKGRDQESPFSAHRSNS
jgi:hypothetical protein